MRSTSFRTGPFVRLCRAMLLLVIVGAAAAGCGGSSDRRLAQTVNDSSPAPAPGGPSAPKGPTTAPPPPRSIPPECGELNTFQLINFSVGIGDVPREKEKKDEAIRTLEATAAAAAAKAPELQSSLKMIVLNHKARLEGQPQPVNPAPGDPTVKEAGEKIGAWSKAHNC